MIKATLLFVSVLALCLAAILDTNEIEGCNSTDELWGSADGTKFYFCLPGTNTSIEQSCPPNKFFVKNATVSGCVPVDIVDSRCVYVGSAEPEPCTGENLRQPQPSQNPTQFYLCTAEGATPLKLTCENGAFIKQNGSLGCFGWPEWRKIRGCPE